jgi:hypothetical protein
MAGSSSDEDENYWPGYVDALTTMTMVLTFIMMVLGVMVFVLSQDAVSSKLGMLARALKIEARTLDKLNQVEIEEALRRAVAMKDSGDGVAPQQAGEQVGIDGEGVVDRTRSNTAWGGSGGQGGSGAGQRGAPATANREATPTDQTRSANGIIGNPGLGPVGLTREAGGQDSGASDRATQGRGQLNSTFTGGLQGDKSAGPGGEYLVTTESTGVAGRERGTGGRLEPGPGALRFVFERGAIDLPPAVAEALQAFVAAQGRGSLVVEATAVANEGGPTDARRKAYFRAMLIRARLIKIGVDPLRIAVRVRDAALLTALETVDVMKPQTGG